MNNNKPWNWKGGRTIINGGYVHIYNPEHPRATMRGYVMEHVLVAEEILGRHLLPNEIPHHIDGTKDNNERSNIMVFNNRLEHNKEHLRMKAFAECGHRDWRKCQFCHRWDSIENLYIRLKRNGTTSEAYHKSCRNKHRRERWKKYGRN